MILRPIFEKLFKFRETVSRQNKSRPGADDGFDPHEKPFLDHLEDLRKTLMKIAAALAITTILGFAFHKQIFEFVLSPLDLATFPDEAGGGSLRERLSFMVLSPPEILMLSIKVSFFAGLIGAFPLLVFFIGEFVLPGLRQQEKKLVIPGIGIGFILFIIGASFAFYMATPIALKFFYQFQIERIGLIKPELPDEQQFTPITIETGEDGTVKATDLKGKGLAALAEESTTATAEALPATEPEPEPEPALPTEPEPATEPVPVPVTEPVAPVEAEDDTAPQIAEHQSKADLLPDEQKESIRDYLMELIVVEKGAGVSVYFDKPTGKIVISTEDRKKIQYRIGEYISFVTRLVLVFGISFQLPVVVTILAKLQLLTARVMRSTRAFAWVIILVLAAIFTPPDVFTLALLGGPLIILYEICIWIAWGIEKNREKARREEEISERDRLSALYSKPADELSEEEKAEMHKREIEQYEREHAHLDEHHYDPHDDAGSESFGHDPHSIGYDPSHDEGWHGDHDHDHHHDDPYHQPDHDDAALDPHQQHDPHENAEAHRPVQDWPDVDDSGDQSFGSEIESDHAEPSDSSEASSDDAPAEDSEDKNAHQACEPGGSIVNPNVATLEDLIALPGVDEELADHILLYRPFDNFDELLEVPGMDEQVLNEIIDRIVLE